MKNFKIVAISDVHSRWDKLIIPECDILISAGDYSFNGYPNDIREFHKWLDKQDARHVISLQGNHEEWVEHNFEEAKLIAQEQCPIVHFIDEGLIEIEGLKIWCSAITPWFNDWAYNRNRGQDIQNHWDKIPNDINILITHGPPYGILDTVNNSDGTPKSANLGCYQLKKKIDEDLKDIDLHFFGHIHSSAGQKHIDSVSYYNAAICDERYHPSNPITIVDYIKE